MNMDTRMAARYPFLEIASQMAAENQVDIESLLSSPTFEDARKRYRLPEIKTHYLFFIPFVPICIFFYKFIGSKSSFF